MTSVETLLAQTFKTDPPGVQGRVLILHGSLDDLTAAVLIPFILSAHVVGGLFFEAAAGRPTCSFGMRAVAKSRKDISTDPPWTT